MPFSPIGYRRSDTPFELPAAPRGAARWGYVLLVLIGGLVFVSGLLCALGSLLVQGEVAIGALAIVLLTVGSLLAGQSTRALKPRRWQPFQGGSMGHRLGLMTLAWLAGMALQLFWPRHPTILFSAVIVWGAYWPSLFFLATTWAGLSSPAGRSRWTGMPLPHHLVFLVWGFSALFATIGSLILEGLLVGMTMRVMLATSYLVGDQPTFDLVLAALRSPDAMEQLSNMIAESPAAFLGVGCVLVFIGPAVEEMLKSLPLLFFARSETRLTERTAILLGAASGAGFAFLEDVLYLSLMPGSWWILFWMRACGASAHGAASGFMGRAWYRGSRQGDWRAMLFDLLKAWGIHALWNALALSGEWFAATSNWLGALFTTFAGLVPLGALFTLMARWGIWVSDK